MTYPDHTDRGQEHGVTKKLSALPSRSPSKLGSRRGEETPQPEKEPYSRAFGKLHQPPTHTSDPKSKITDLRDSQLGRARRILAPSSGSALCAFFRNTAASAAKIATAGVHVRQRRSSAAIAAQVPKRTRSVLTSDGSLSRDDWDCFSQAAPV
jgi:hypothetical protein